MSPYSAFAYNILNIGIIFPWVYITTIILYPGASIWLGIFITGVFTGFLAVVYAGLASAMPRTGGDYVFQSRTLRPWLGFAIVSTMIITFFLQWQALGGWLVAILGFAPLFTGLGLTTGNTMFIDWGVWFSTPTGAMVTTMVTSTFAALILIKSFRWFVQIQWVMWYGFLLSYLVMVVMFFITPTATFISRYDRAATIIANSGPGAYQGVLSTAIANGFTPNRAFDLLGTLLITPVALTSLGWVGYAQEQAGEIQGAQSLRNQMFINLGGGLVSTLMMAVLALAMVGTVDQQWLAAAAGSGARIRDLHPGRHGGRDGHVHRDGHRRCGLPPNSPGGVPDVSHRKIQSRSGPAHHHLRAHRRGLQRVDALLVHHGAVPRNRESFGRLRRCEIAAHHGRDLRRLDRVLLRAPGVPKEPRNQPRPGVQGSAPDLGDRISRS